MNIEQIISTTTDQEARDHIRRQYQSDLKVLGEREALEFARFRAAHAYAYYLAATAHQQAARQAKQSFHRALIIGAIYAAALAFALGIILGRAL